MSSDLDVDTTILVAEGDNEEDVVVGTTLVEAEMTDTDVESEGIGVLSVLAVVSVTLTGTVSDVLSVVVAEAVACEPDADEMDSRVVLMLIVDPEESVVVTSVEVDTRLVVTLESVTADEVESVVLALSVQR